MIITLTGHIAKKADDFAIFEVFGVGYQVFMPATLLDSLKVGEEAKVWTYEHLREDIREMFGVATEGDLRLFRRLVGISGIGPRMALGILNLGSTAEVEQMIERGDVEALSRVPRIGRKSAQKIVLELKGKLVDIGMDRTISDVVAALVGMGYQREAAREAVEAVAKTNATEEGRLRAALRRLAK